MRNWARYWPQSRSGNVAVMTAMMMPVLLAGTAVTSDTIQWVLVRRALQRQADSAAIAGALAIAQSRGVADTVLADLAKNSNFALAAQPTIENAPSQGPYSGDAMAVRVALAANSALPFSNVILGRPVTIQVQATARLVSNGDYCFMALDPTESTSISNAGNATVQADCGLHANSSGAAAVDAQGNVSVTATPVSAVGGIGGRASFAPGTLFIPYNIPQPDPFAQVPWPAPTGPIFNNVRVKSNTSATLSPGIYRGGLDIAGSATLLPGIYYIDGRGGNSGLSVGAQAQMIGQGVTLVLTRETPPAPGTTAAMAGLTINGGAHIDLSAPTTGPYRGILFYQDPRSPTLSDTIQINGNSSSRLEGAIYVPKNIVLFNGTTGMNFNCTQIVGYRLVFSGNSVIRNLCPAGSGASPIRGTAVRLVA